VLWVLVDVLLGVAALGVLAAVGWRLWVAVRALGATVARAGETVGELSAGLEVRPPGAEGDTSAR
jgi:hypothetical protein